MIAPVDDQYDGTLIHWISSLGTGTRPPVFIKEGLKFTDLLFEFSCGAAFQLDLMPNQPARDGMRLHCQPRSFRVIHVCKYEDGRRMIREPIRHLVERQSGVFQTYLFASHIERHMGKTSVHAAHHPCQHCAVTDSRIKDTERRRTWMNIGEFMRHTSRDDYRCGRREDTFDDCQRSENSAPFEHQRSTRH